MGTLLLTTPKQQTRGAKFVKITQLTSANNWSECQRIGPWRRCTNTPRLLLDLITPKMSSVPCPRTFGKSCLLLHMVPSPHKRRNGRLLQLLPLNGKHISTNYES